jgi:hypothetical protein
VEPFILSSQVCAGQDLSNGGLALLLALVLLMVASGGGLGAYYLFVCAAPVAIAGALWLFWTLKGRRKAAAGFVGFLFPLVLFVSADLGQTLRISLSSIETREQVTRCILLSTAEALEQYHTDYGRHPASLTELLQSEIPFPQRPRSDSACYDPNAREWMTPHNVIHSAAGWLYSASEMGDHYELAFWQDLPDFEMFGVRVCVYGPESRTVRCTFNWWGPFRPASEG